MDQNTHPHSSAARNISFGLLCTLLIILLVAGGASRADALGQIVVRAATWVIVIVAILFAPRPQWRDSLPMAGFVLIAILLVALQLIPLPPYLWLSLPGRSLFGDAGLLIGEQQPWRPLSISPSATLNAWSSLIVPLATLMLVASLPREKLKKLPGLLLALVCGSCFVGLLQLSGAGFANPLINNPLGDVSGTFANRNHFALFASLGCTLAPMWGFSNRASTRWKGPVSFGLTLLLILVILSSGSRAGMVLGLLGLALGVLSVWREVVTYWDALPEKIRLPIGLAAVGSLGAAIYLSVIWGRAISVQRIFSLDATADLRGNLTPVVTSMIEKYFPWGTGFGTFDRAFRISEPDAMLATKYYNHAHNDLLEIALDGGLPGLILLFAAIVWWLRASVQAWWTKREQSVAFARVGSAMLLLILIASILDYPARTPMIMAVIVIAGALMNGGGGRASAGKSA